MDQELNEILKKLGSLKGDLYNLEENVSEQYKNVTKSVTNFKNDIDKIEKEFDELTKLHKEDYYFVFFCAALQAFRQYQITNFKERLSDKEAAKEVKGTNTEKSDRNKTRYYCSITNMISNPVPFDAMEHNEKINTGISGANHRAKCLGHDPILGYIFGTANIMTSTLTVKEGLANVRTFHVKTATIEQTRFYKKTFETKNYHFQKDFIDAKADTGLMFEHCWNRIKENPRKGMVALLTALAKEHEHLRSDEKTKQSLPFPFLNLTPEITQYLGEYGFDYLNFKTIAKQSSYSYFINLITEILYYAYLIGKRTSLANSKELDKEKIQITNPEKVRLKKIINIANVIAVSTNLSTVFIGLLEGNLNLIRKFDIGGELVTLRSLVKSADFMIKVKEEYISENINKLNQELC